MTKQEMIDQEPNPEMKKAYEKALEDGKEYMTVEQFQAKLDWLIEYLEKDEPVTPIHHVHSSSRRAVCVG